MLEWEAHWHGKPAERDAERVRIELGTAAGATDDLAGLEADYPERPIPTPDGLRTEHRCRHCGRVGGH